MRQLKSSVDELSIEIPSHVEMYEFVKLKKEISSSHMSLTRKFTLLKAVEEPILNLRVNDNVQQLKHFLKQVATDISVIEENVEIPEPW